MAEASTVPERSSRSPPPAPSRNFPTLHLRREAFFWPPMAICTVRPSQEAASALGAFSRSTRRGVVTVLHSFDGGDGANPVGLVSLYKDSFYRGTFLPLVHCCCERGRLRFGIAVSTFLCRTPGLVRPFATERKPLRTVNHPLRRGEILQEFCHGL